MLAASLTAVSGAQAAAAPRLDVYVGDLSRADLAKIVALGVDRHELEALEGARQGRDPCRDHPQRQPGAQARARRRRARGQEGRRPVRRPARHAEAADGMEVFKRYDEIKAEVEQRPRRATRRSRSSSASARPTRASDIVGIKISRGALQQRDGVQAVHALHRRAARARVDHAGDEPPAHALPDRRTTTAATGKIRRLLDEHEVWIIPVANPDGYEYTFTEGQRLWRKNLRDNDGDGQITGPTAWTSTATSTTSGATTTRAPRRTRRALTYRGPCANSEPESKALDALVRAGRARVLRQLPLRRGAAALRRSAGRSRRRRPDDIIGEAMAGDDEHPAVPGYDPDISAELYTTNGDTDTHMPRIRRFGFTPEMATCEAASDSVPGRRVGGRGLRQRLRVPRRRGAGRGRVPQEHPVRARRWRNRRATRTTRCPWSAASAGLPARHVRASPTATRRPSR